MVVRANGFVDATGDAAVVWQAGLECREPAEGVIYGSQMIVIENFDDAKKPSREEMSARIRERGEQYGLVRRDGFAMSFPGRATAVVNMTHIETPLDPLESSRIGIEGKEQADRTMDFLRSEFPEAFGQARVRAYGLPGIRQTRWIVGRHHLTVDEVRQGVKFPDSIARTAWPLEQHHHAEGYVWEPFDADHVHYVPLGSMTPPGADNLLAAGRCIDGDATALSSVRVMGPCIAMGAAAAHASGPGGNGQRAGHRSRGAAPAAAGEYRRLKPNLAHNRSMRLTDQEKAMLDGAEGPAKQKAMDLLVRYGEALGAERFVDVTNIAGVPGSSTLFLHELLQRARRRQLRGRVFTLRSG